MAHEAPAPEVANEACPAGIPKPQQPVAAPESGRLARPIFQEGPGDLVLIRRMDEGVSRADVDGYEFDHGVLPDLQYFEATLVASYCSM